MKPKALAIVTLLLMMTISGCGGPSPSEIGEVALMSSIGILILSIPIIMLLAWLASLNLGRSKILWGQFVGLVLVSIGLFFRYGGNLYSDTLWVIAVIGVISVPYLLLVASLAVLFLPARVCRFLPILIMTPHFVINILLVITDSKDLLEIFPLMLPIRFWPLTIGLLLITIGSLIILKWKKRQQDNKTEDIS